MLFENAGSGLDPSKVDLRVFSILIVYDGIEKFYFSGFFVYRFYFKLPSTEKFRWTCFSVNINFYYVLDLFILIYWYGELSRDNVFNNFEPFLS
jgi:hypothetical protein